MARNTSYSTGMLDKLIAIQNRKASQLGDFGMDSEGTGWETTISDVPADVSWKKGVRALSEGAIDAYGVIEIRMRYYAGVNMRSRIVYEGETYQILPETFHADYQANTIQFLAQVIINENNNGNGNKENNPENA